MSDTPPNQPDTLDIAALEAALSDVRLGHPLIYFPMLDPTNTYAVQQARVSAAEGTLVTTDDQTAGRGRVGRAWRSLPGQQLALSLILRPCFPPHFLVMATSLAVAEAIEGVTGLRADIKWPNDVQVAARKVCGILIETGADFAVVGIGVNVNGSLADDPELAARATTLEEATRHPLSRETLAEEIVRALDVHYAALQAGGEPAPRAPGGARRARGGPAGPGGWGRRGTGGVGGRAQRGERGGGPCLRPRSRTA